MATEMSSPHHSLQKDSEKLMRWQVDITKRNEEKEMRRRYDTGVIEGQKLNIRALNKKNEQLRTEIANINKELGNLSDNLEDTNQEISICQEQVQGVDDCLKATEKVQYAMFESIRGKDSHCASVNENIENLHKLLDMKVLKVGERILDMKRENELLEDQKIEDKVKIDTEIGRHAKLTKGYEDDFLNQSKEIEAMTEILLRVEREIESDNKEFLESQKISINITEEFGVKFQICLSEVNHLNSQKDVLDDDITKTSEILVSNTEKNDTLKSKLKAAEAENSTAEQELAKIQDTLYEYKTNLSSLESELSVEKESNDNMNLRMKDLSQKKIDLKMLTEDILVLKERNDCRERDRAKMNDVEDEKQALSNHLADLEEMLVAAEQFLKITHENEHQLYEIQRNLKETVSYLKTMEERRKDKTGIICRLENLHKAMREELTLKKMGLNDNQLEQSQLLDKLDSLVLSCNAELAARLDELNQIEKDLRNQSSEIDRKDNSVVEVTECVEQARENLESKLFDLREAEEHFKSQESKIADIKSEIDRFSELMYDRQNRKESFIDSLNMMVDTIHSNEIKMRSLQNEKKMSEDDRMNIEVRAFGKRDYFYDRFNQTEAELQNAQEVLKESILEDVLIQERYRELQAIFNEESDKVKLGQGSNQQSYKDAEKFGKKELAPTLEQIDSITTALEKIEEKLVDLDIDVKVVDSEAFGISNEQENLRTERDQVQSKMNKMKGTYKESTTTHLSTPVNTKQSIKSPVSKHGRTKRILLEPIQKKKTGVSIFKKPKMP